LKKLLLNGLILLLSGAAFAQDYVDGQLYVKVNDDSEIRLDQAVKQSSVEPYTNLVLIFEEFEASKLVRPFTALKSPIFDRTYQITFSKAEETSAFIEALEALTFIEYAERVPLYSKFYTPNDPGFSSQWYLPKIKADKAWDSHKGGNATLAIVDDAVYIAHSDLSPNVWTNTGEIANNGIDDDNNGYIDDINGYDVADNDNNPNPPTSRTNTNFTHGTHCAGIAGAATDNGSGIASIGFNNKLIAVKATRDIGNSQAVEAAFAGVVYAIAAGADVVSMSWGGPASSTTGQNIITNGYNSGVTFVAAAGNSNTSAKTYPAAFNFVISVAATNQSDQRANFSNYGSWIDISSPGVSIFSSLAGSSTSYGNQDGTSMACPLVAGLCALIKSANPSLTPSAIESCLKSTADNIDNLNPGFAGRLGAGRINAEQAMTCSNPNSAPVAGFNSNAANEICSGTSVSFTDASSFNPTSWNWSFPGGTPSSSTQQNPTVVYNTNGTFNVSLTVTNANGTNTKTEVGFVKVNSNGLEEFFTEDFENNAPTWSLFNPDMATTWTINTVGGTNGGSKAAGINLYNYSSGIGQIDALFTPVLDFGGRSSVTLTFEHAYRRYSQNERDSLLILLSTDGGATFPNELLAASEDGTGSFATNTVTQSNFVPATLDDWCFAGQIGAQCIELDLSAYDGMANIVLAFASVNRHGNNMYIDNVKLSSKCGVPNNTIQPSFIADVQAGCPGLTVQYTDQSLANPNITSWSWSFPGGNPSSSTQQNPVVVYPNAGTFDVSLQVSNASQTNATTESNFISVNGSAASIVFNEDFEGAINWQVSNPDNSLTWVITEDAKGLTGTKAATINNFNYNAAGQEDILFSPSIDLTGKSNLRLTLDYAHAKYSNNYTDSLLIYASNNGGTSYTLLFEGGDNGNGSFSTSPNFAFEFIPQSADDWCGRGNFGAQCVDLDFSAFDNVSDVKIAFVSKTDYGNNIYLDNVRVSSSCQFTPTHNLSSSNISLEIFPNPAHEQVFIKLLGSSIAKWVDVFDVHGKKVYGKKLSQNNFNINVEGWSKGLYIIRTETNQGSLSSKLVVE